MDWLLVAVMFAVSAMQDTCYAMESVCLAHDHPWWASGADLIGMLVNKGSIALIAAVVAVQGNLDTTAAVIVAGAVGGASGTRCGAFLAKRIERHFTRKTVPHG